MSNRKNLAYRCWTGMLARCRDQNSDSYARYGAKGITVCDRWKNSFDLFLADIGPRPSKQHSIDRIDGTKGYEPDNVRWSTAKEQAANLSNNVWLEYKGKRLHLYDWSRETGINVMTLHSRLFRFGWPVERALTTTSLGRNVPHRVTPEVRAEMDRLVHLGLNKLQIANAVGVSHSRVCDVLNNGAGIRKRQALAKATLLEAGPEVAEASREQKTISDALEIACPPKPSQTPLQYKPLTSNLPSTKKTKATKSKKVLTPPSKKLLKRLADANKGFFSDICKWRLGEIEASEVPEINCALIRLGEKFPTSLEEIVNCTC